jgi:dTDP-4-dehydrorhamnose 3,5-epimerase
VGFGQGALEGLDFVKFLPLRLPGAFVIELAPYKDVRGSFTRVYDDKLFAEHGLSTTWVQDNVAYNVSANIVRGMHFQRPPHTETKLVRVVRGAIFDVIVDLRRGSPTFGQFEGVELSENVPAMLYVPRGFAHGYCTLSDAIVAYKVDAYYAPGSEGGLRYDDPKLAIPWPINSPPSISDKDRVWPVLEDIDSPFTWSAP